MTSEILIIVGRLNAGWRMIDAEADYLAGTWRVCPRCRGDPGEEVSGVIEPGTKRVEGQINGPKCQVERIITMTEQQTVEWTAPAPRTVVDIARDLRDADDRLRDIERPLSTPRNRLAGAIWTSDDEAYLAACRAEHIGPLEQAEAAAITAFDEEIARLQADEQRLGGGAFKPSLSAAEELRLPVALLIVKTQMETLDAGDLEQAVRTALLHSDRPTLAAYASLAGILAQRNLPDDHGARAALADARRAVEDPSSARVRQELKAAITTAQHRRFAVVDAANGEAPGSQGSYLERYVFGQAPVGGPAPQAARNVDWSRLMRRCGRAA